MAMKTREEIEEIIWAELCANGTPAHVQGVGLTGSADRKWNVFLVGDGPATNGEALLRAQTISDRLMLEHDLARG